MSNITNATTDALLASNTLVNEIVIAIGIFLLGLIIGRIAGRLVGRFVKNFGVDGFVKKKTSLKFSMEKFIGGLVSVVIYIVFFIIALNYVGITSLLINVLSFIIIIVIAITAILAIKDSIPNFVAYRKITKVDRVRISDFISFDNVSGTVIDMDALEVQIETKSKDIIHIPNCVFVKKMYSVKRKKNKE